MMAKEKSVHECRFEAAAKVLRSLPDDGLFQPSDDLKLRFYGYYKQATQGPCNIPKPGFWDSEGKAKWEAWNSLGDMLREEAMKAYVEEVKLILETIPVTVEVEELLDVLGPFYEIEEEELMESKSKSFQSMPTSLLECGTEGNDGLVEVNGKVGSSNANFESDINESEEDEEEDEADDEQQEEQKVDNGHECVATRKAGNTSSLFMDHRVLSRCSIDHSISSATSHAHSSLDSENLEEELICIDSAQEDILCVPHEDASGLVLLTSDSDNEVYCDSIEQFGTVLGHMELLNQPLQLTGDTKCPQVSSMDLGAQSRGEEDVVMKKNLSQSNRLHAEEQKKALPRRGRGSSLSGMSSRSRTYAEFQSRKGGDCGSEEGRTVDAVDEKIATALFRLEEDMRQVLHKLHTLETLSEEQARSMAAKQNHPVFSGGKDASWWPFDVSLCTVVFAVAWPFMVHWLVQLYLYRQSRKLS